MKSLRRAIGKFLTAKGAGASNSPSPKGAAAAKPAPKSKPKATYRYVFIFTFGRSGSTLLMGYLNSLPGFCIRGENYNAVAHLCAAYKSAKDTRGQIAKKSMQVVHPWYGADLVDLERMRQSIRDTFVRTFINPPAGTKVVGCKEIRINRNDLEDFDGFLETLQEVFGEDVKIVFNHRDITATSQSAWWKDTAHAYSTIRAMDQRMRTSRFADAPNVFHVEYEELIKGPDHARDLATFLGVDFDQTMYDGVMATRHSY